ncbi:MAG TPA: hypothetical protein VKX17_13220 [Planctomycetota bacterium]|nr:hypothetical protein [Planctomycetota bacterium]
MNRAACIFALCLLSLQALAHLNHNQFAAVDEVDGKLLVRYRMSADMFMSNLEIEIKAGHIDAAIKLLPINEIIARYFKTHLRLDVNNVSVSAESVSFTMDAKNGDWIAGFKFTAPPIGAEASLFCDAFLENNPRTQTLARINWRGEKTVFHFRKDSTRCQFGSSLHESSAEAAPKIEAPRAHFLNGLAEALRSYEWLAAGALVFCALRVVSKDRLHYLVFGLTAVASLVLTPVQFSLAAAWGFRFGWTAVVLTGQKLLFDTINRRTGHA